MEEMVVNEYVTMEKLLSKAIEIATKAHSCQMDKAGESYIGHPLRVMKMGRTVEEKIVGVLHDVVEDSDYTFEDLSVEGFDENIISALRCVTKTSEDEDYEAFIERCAQNPLAVAVKIHDLTDNMDIRRLNDISERDVVRLKKYLKAYKRLLPLYNIGRKKVLYVDMDGVLVDFNSGQLLLDEKTKKEYAGRLDEVPHFFSTLKPLPGAVESFLRLSERYDTYILSTAPWNNPTALSDKKEWVKKYIGDSAKKRLILTHQKNLNRGDYLIDDRTLKGAGEFEGELILFGSEKFPDWKAVEEYLEV